MTYCFHIMTALMLVILQTSLMTAMDVFRDFCDLLAVFVIYLSLLRPLREGMIMAFFAGLLTDTLSGGPWGLHMTAYLWLYGLTRWIVGYLHVGNIILTPFIVAGGILFENTILVGTVATLEKGLYFPQQVLQAVAIQVTWAFLTGPFIIFGIKNMQKRWDLWRFRVMSENS